MYNQSNMPVAFTICSNNYMAKAWIVAKTFLNKHADYSFFIFLVDEFVSEIDYKSIPELKVVAIKDIMTNIDELAKMYNIIELNTAVKPFVFTFLFKEYKSSHILYLDPDLMIFDRFSEIEEQLSHADCNIIVTPHGCSPIDDGKIPSEIHITVYGIYNLGFIAVKHSPESQKFLDWWHDRLMKYCYIDPENGMFTDQIWINYAPIFFDGVYILKHRGYNVSHWNLYERRIDAINGTYYVNGVERLKFFHFSHYKFTNPYLISHKQNRHLIDDFEHLRTIIDEYQASLVRNNHEVISKIPCHYQLLYEAHQQARRKQDKKFKYSGFKNLIKKVKSKTVWVGRRLLSP